MIIKDDAAMQVTRDRGMCECGCQRRVWPLEAHHCYVKRGMGGGRRLDVACNLIGLTWVCHAKAEHSTVFNESLKRIIAQREGTTVEAIVDYLNLILRTDKNATRPLPPWENVAA